jgi:hypothetical protein
MKKHLVYIIPTIICVPLFLFIIKPGIFNMIPFMIHQSFFRGVIKEINFVYLFDLLFCITLWYILYRVCKVFR